MTFVPNNRADNFLAEFAFVCLFVSKLVKLNNKTTANLKESFE